LPLKAARRDSNCNITSCEASNLSCRHKSNAVSFRVAVGHHVNAAQTVCDGQGQNKIVTVGKNSGPV